MTADAGAPQEVVDLADRRAEARATKDFAKADALRAEIVALGWTVVDEPGGWRLEPLAPPEAEPEGPRRVHPEDVESVLDEPAAFDVSLQWVVEGWSEDVLRALAGFRAYGGVRTVQYVVADVTGEDPAIFGEDVEVVSLPEGIGWASARNAGLKRSRGRIVLVLDGSIEPTGDVVEPLEAALRDPSVGVCGPFGIITRDLRSFEESAGPEVDAVEGYLMAFRREMLDAAGLFDEKFRFYRTADIEYSFRVKEAGFRALVVPVPATKHEHRMWFNTPPDERAKWSKRNYYRFLDRFRGRFDLTVAGHPPEGERD